jgi:hypothetical protein
MAELILRVGSTNRLTLSDVELPEDVPLTSISGSFELTAVINDGAGEADPTGASFPLNFSYDSTTDSDWYCLIPAALELIAERSYFAIVDLNDGTYRIGHWKIPFTAKNRDAIDVL